MNSALDCIPCFIRQALEAARFVTDDEAVCEDILRRTLRLTSDMDLSDSPPAVAARINRMVRELTGVNDPYLRVKNEYNDMALDMLPGLKARVKAADDPFRMAVLLAVAGNVIDFGVKGDLTQEMARQAVENCLEQPFDGDVAAFQAEAQQTESILYLMDNAGEAVLDRLLLEQLPLKRVTIAVRGEPILNDVTLPDARRAGLTEMAPVIHNGSDAPGTVLETCSADFLDRFHAAGMVIAKGQGNYESLSHAPRPVHFLFKVKCPVVANQTGHAQGTHLLLRSGG